MGSFFSLEGPFYKFGTLLADIMLLSLLWIVFSIPVFTAGASTSALYYVITRRIGDKEGYLFRDFWASFKQNFKQSTIVWLILSFVTGLIIFNILNINTMGNMKNIILPLQFCILFELALVNIYIYPLIARFDMDIKTLFKTAFFMSNRHIPTSILCIVIGLGVLYISFVTIIFSVVSMGVYIFATSYFIVRIFKKYRPEFDKEEMIGESIDHLFRLKSLDSDVSGPTFDTYIPEREENENIVINEELELDENRNIDTNGNFNNYIPPRPEDDDNL